LLKEIEVIIISGQLITKKTTEKGFVILVLSLFGIIKIMVPGLKAKRGSKEIQVT